MMRRVGPLLIGLAWCASALGAAQDDLEVPPNAPVVWCTRFSIEYTVRDIGSSGPTKVEFYMTTDMGRTWKLYGEDPDARSPMMIKVPGEGVYGFMSVGTDHVGNRERPPARDTRPEMVVVVDRTPPAAKWIKPDKTALLQPGGITFAWETQDKHPAARPVSIEYSSDAGRTWLPLKDRLHGSGETTLPAPTVRGAKLSFRLVARDRAGNRRIRTCPHQVLMDKTAPTVAVTGPAISGKLAVDIDYAAQDNPGGTGIEKVRLFYTVDSGEQWHEYGLDDDAESPMRFDSPVAGAVGVMLVATDKAGNTSRVPKAGDPPPFAIVFDNEPPQVSFSPRLPGGKNTLRGGQVEVIRWQATDANIEEKSAVLYYSPDGGKKWERIAENLPVNGPYRWKVPRDEANGCLLKVSVADSLGNRGEAQSLAFKIDSVPPEVVFERIEERREADEGPVEAVDEDGSETEEPRGPKISKDRPGDVFPRDDASTAEEGGAAVWPAAEELPQPDAEEGAVGRIEVPRLPDERPEEGAKETPAPPSLPKSEDRREIDQTWLDEGTPKPSEQPRKGLFPVPPPPDEGETEPPAEEPAPRKDPAKEPAKAPAKEPTEEPLARVPETTPEPAPAPVETGDVRQRAAALVERAEDHFRNGRSREALRSCRQAIRLDPANDGARGLLAKILFAEGEFPAAAAEAREAVRLNPDQADYWITLGNACDREARAVGAQYKRRAQAEPSDPQAITLRERRDALIAEACKAFHRVTRLEPDEKRGYDRLGAALYFQALAEDFERLALKRGSDAKRAEYYRQAIQAFQQSYNVGHATYREAFHLGVSHYRLNELDKAKTYLERAVEEARQVVPKEAFWYLAEIHEKQGRFEDALRYWEKTIETYEAGPYRTKAQERANELRRRLGE